MDGLAALRSGDWVVLRTEIEPWDEDEAEKVAGFDGFTRFWCPEAVFDIYWVAESEGSSLSILLTDDMILTGFRHPIRLDREPVALRELAEYLRWRDHARTALEMRQRHQFDLFEDE